MSMERKTTLPPEAKRVFKGEIFEVYQWPQALYDGSVATFEKLKRADTVMVIPVTEDGTILLAHEEQPGKPLTLGFVSGRIEEGEDPVQAARRELLEETGYQGEADPFLISEEQPFSKMDWNVYLFLVRKCKKVAEQSLDPGERINLRKVTFDELVELVVQGHMSYSSFSDRILRAKLEPQKMRELYELIYSS